MYHPLRFWLTGLLLSAFLLNVTACSKKPNPAVPSAQVPEPAVRTAPAELPPPAALPEPPPVPLFKKIHLEVNATSWYAAPFKDMREFLTKELAPWGIRPVTDTEPASATLKIDYNEKKGQEFNLGTGTRIDFYLELYVAPPDKELLWDTGIDAKTPDSFTTDLISESDPCRSRAFDNFRNQFDGPPSLSGCVAALMGHPDAVKLLLEQANWGKPGDRARQVLEKAGIEPTDPLSRAKIAITRDEIKEEYAQFGAAILPELIDAAFRVITTGRCFSPEEASAESVRLSAERTAKLTLILKIYQQVKDEKETEDFRAELAQRADSTFSGWNKIPVNLGAIGCELLTAEMKSLIRSDIYLNPAYGFYNFCLAGQAQLLYPPKEARPYLVEMLKEYRNILLKDYDILKPELRFSDFCNVVVDTIKAVGQTGDPTVREVLEETARQYQGYAGAGDDRRADVYRATQEALNQLSK